MFAEKYNSSLKMWAILRLRIYVTKKGEANINTCALNYIVNKEKRDLIAQYCAQN